MSNDGPTTPQAFMQRILELLMREEEISQPEPQSDGSIYVTVHCIDHQVQYGQADCRVRLTLAPIGE
jgi:hypothetical protein